MTKHHEKSLPHYESEQWKGLQAQNNVDMKHWKEKCDIGRKDELQ